jgi:hypothetical protein
MTGEVLARLRVRAFMLAGLMVAILGCKDGRAACTAAGGQCVFGGDPTRCAKIGPQNCDPDVNPGGAVCCFASKVTGDTHCDELRERGAAALELAATHADRNCASDADCVLVGKQNDCADTCDDVLSKAGKEAFLRDVAEQNATTCSEAKAQQCVTVHPPCISLGGAVCAAGRCIAGLPLDVAQDAGGG